MSHHQKHHHDHNEKKQQKEEVDIPEIDKEVSQKAQEAKTEVREPKNVTISDLELENLRKEALDNKDKYMRNLAESENARKRLQKEKQDLIQYAVQNVIVDFLSPIDYMENALKYTENQSDEVKHWATGFQMILGQFKDVLTNNGIQPILSVGKPYDHHLQEAIEMVETDQFAPGTVIEESVRGYKMGDRTIRPARVKVAKEKKSETTE